MGGLGSLQGRGVSARPVFTLRIMRMSSSEETRPDLDRLFEDLSHPNPNIQNQAFWAMVEHYPQESMPRLLALLDQSDTSLRRAAVRGMGAFGEISLQPLAEKFRSSEDGTVRASCVKAYVQVAANYPDEPFSKDAMAVLEEALEDDCPVVSQSAVMALGQVGKQGAAGKQALPLLLKICQGENIAHMQSAVMALGEIDDPDSEASLRALLADESMDPLVKEVAESSLARFENMKANRPVSG